MGEPFNILDFPVEIIQHIFFFINETKGYASFRQSCKYCTHVPTVNTFIHQENKKTNSRKNGEISGHVISYQNYLQII